MYLVTGGAGFIGSHIVRTLTQHSGAEVVVADDLSDGDKFENLADCTVADYLDKDELRRIVREDRDLPGLEGICHQGACTDTTCIDGRYMMDNNFTCSKELLHYALDRGIPLVYASSAAVYGTNIDSAPRPANERPRNVYGYSKLAFDQYVRHFLRRADSTLVGLRYFNVYGPAERHKRHMASMVTQLHDRLERDGVARLFEGTDGYADGEQRRDFVYVEDAVRVNLHFLQGPPQTGIVNVGTGFSRSFNDVAEILIEGLDRGRVEYIPFPESLRGKYQSFTEADLESLRELGYERPFLSLETGIARVLEASAPGQNRTAGTTKDTR